MPLPAQLTTPPGATCDPATGLCSPSPIPAPATAPNPIAESDLEIIYVGDPLCSWCWGISPALNHLERAATANGIPYRIVLGGLRPGGGDPWNEEFQNFLRHHWEEVTARSGQPFGEALFAREQFNYDTEPPCRAVVTARTLDPTVESRFFELIQHRFYVLGEDPNEVTFYQPICAATGVDFTEFVKLFGSPEMLARTQADFQLNRRWGVTGYPTVVVRKGDRLYAIARGYAEFDAMWGAVEEIVGRE